MKRFVYFASLLLMFTVAACGQAGPVAEDGKPKETVRETATGSADGKANDSADGNAAADNGETAGDKSTRYPITVQDATGFEMTFEHAPTRIVSVSPSETEILFALGLGDKIYGVSDFDNYPAEAADKPKMGGVVKPNEEAIIGANPDLVIGGLSIEEDVTARFRSLGISLYKTEANTLEDILDNILQLGVITDTQAEAEALVAQMKEDIRKVTEAASTLQEADKQKVYVEFAPGWTVGKGEYLDELITLSGGINIAGDQEGWIQLNEEKVILDNPDVILYADINDYNTGEPLAAMIKSRPGWSQIAAIRNDRMAVIDDDLLARPGPRITQGLLDIADAIYPGLVKR